jgi:hypothetical protein
MLSVIATNDCRKKSPAPCLTWMLRQSEKEALALLFDLSGQVKL